MTDRVGVKPAIAASLKKLEKWIEGHNYKGYDPGDGLTSFLRPLTFGNLFLERLLMQVVWKSPINIRPLIGVKPLESFIGGGYMAWGYLVMYNLTKDESYKSKAVSMLSWLKRNKAPDFEHYSWGKMFDFSSRGGRQKRFEPITIWTSLIGMAFLEAYEILGDQEFLNIADSICCWIMERPRNYTSTGCCINYTPFGEGNCTIHNQSMVAAAMLARTYKHSGNSDYLSLANEAVTYTCTRQLSNGAWLYGEEPKYHWIDNFHTGYNLDALKCYIESTDDRTFDVHLKNGFYFFINNFFEKDGMPKYYHNRTYPIDSQCCSQSIETLTNFFNYNESSLNRALRVAKWTIENMQDREGYFYFRRFQRLALKAPMIHWAQATTYKALACLLQKTNQLININK